MSQNKEKKVHFFYSHEEAETNGCFVATTVDGEQFTYTSSYTNQNDAYNGRFPDSELAMSIEPSKITERKYSSLSDLNAQHFEDQLNSGYPVPSIKQINEEMDKIMQEPLLQHTGDVFDLASGKKSTKAMLGEMADANKNPSSFLDVANHAEGLSNQAPKEVIDVSFNKSVFEKVRKTLNEHIDLGNNDKPKNKF